MRVLFAAGDDGEGLVDLVRRVGVRVELLHVVEEVLEVDLAVLVAVYLRDQLVQRAALVQRQLLPERLALDETDIGEKGRVRARRTFRQPKSSRRLRRVSLSLSK